MAVLGVDLRASRKKPSSIAILDSQSHLTELASFFEDSELIRLVNDINPNIELDSEFNLEWANKEKIYKEADIVSLHLPLTGQTKNLIRKKHLLMFKHDSILINTSRGGIINEEDLYEVMKSGYLCGAAIDVFEREPYYGPLREVERCLLTAHMGSMSVDCRARMEIESTEEAIRFLTGKKLESEVPLEEYDLQSQIQCNDEK